MHSHITSIAFDDSYVQSYLRIRAFGMLIIKVERVHPIILTTTVSTLNCFPSSLFFINSLWGKRVIRIIISLDMCIRDSTTTAGITMESEKVPTATYPSYGVQAFPSSQRQWTYRQQLDIIPVSYTHLALIDNLINSKNHCSALFNLRQLSFGIFDYKVHSEELTEPVLNVVDLWGYDV